MKQPKPLALSDVVGGQFYINVKVSLRGEMMIEYLVFCGKPFKSEFMKSIRLIRAKSSHGFTYEPSTKDLGLEPTKHNEHRVFRFTEQNRRILKKLVEGQNIKGYLDLIGASNDTETIICQYTRQAEEDQDWDWDDLEELDED